MTHDVYDKRTVNTNTKGEATLLRKFKEMPIQVQIEQKKRRKKKKKKAKVRRRGRVAKK